MPSREKITRVVELGTSEIERFAAVLTDEERSAVGTPDDWAIRDIYAHMVEWLHRMVDSIIIIRAGGPSPIRDEDENILNREIYFEYQSRTWEDMLRTLGDSRQGLLALLNELSPEELDDRERFPFFPGRPLWQSIVSDSYIHPLAHINPIYIQRGDIDYANQMSEAEARNVAELDDSPRWKALSYYNLACHYALIGDREHALENLQPSFELRPDLVPWSRQDSDLVSLHEDEGYLALIESYAQS